MTRTIAAMSASRVRVGFDYPMLRADMLVVIEQHKDLDGRAINLFRNALKGQWVRSIGALSQAAPLPSRLSLHVHDPV
jgi:hypothetical protein